MIEKGAVLSIERLTDKSDVIDAVDKWRFDLGLGVEEINGDKPWGAYWKIDKRYLGQFLKLFFPENYLQLEDWKQNLSPKLLLVEPGEKLSWQYHNRRSEEWEVVAGEVGIKVSASDEEPSKIEKYRVGDGITIEGKTRHRLIGLDGWGLVAEIWMHSDSENPSNEEDIVRLIDEYGREN